MTDATTPTTNAPSTQEKIKELEDRLAIGVNKLLDLELAGLWDANMFAYWLKLEASYIKLCKAASLFELQ